MLTTLAGVRAGFVGNYDLSVMLSGILALSFVVSVVGVVLFRAMSANK